MANEQEKLSEKQLSDVSGGINVEAGIGGGNGGSEKSEYVKSVDLNKSIVTDKKAELKEIANKEVFRAEVVEKAESIVKAVEDNK